jgi:hypothetical protein
VLFVHLDVFLHAAEHAEFRFDAQPFRMAPLHDPLGDRDILIERLVRGVDHHRRVKAGVDAIVAGLLVAVIEMHRVDRFGKDVVAERMIASSMRLSVYLRAPFETWMITAPGSRYSHGKVPSSARRC